MNTSRYQITEDYNVYPYGRENRIIASAATLRGCLSQYQKHIKTWELAKLDRKALATRFYCDGVRFDVESSRIQLN
jgi:hypothetical protein